MNKSKEYLGMTHHLHVFTIFKRDYNVGVGVTIIIYVFDIV